MTAGCCTKRYSFVCMISICLHDLLAICSSKNRSRNKSDRIKCGGSCKELYYAEMEAYSSSKPLASKSKHAPGSWYAA
eukprot:64291-Pleurochrysis_carterae.AAC.1